MLYCNIIKELFFLSFRYYILVMKMETLFRVTVFIAVANDYANATNYGKIFFIFKATFRKF